MSSTSEERRAEARDGEDARDALATCHMRVCAAVVELTEAHRLAVMAQRGGQPDFTSRIQLTIDSADGLALGMAEVLPPLETHRGVVRSKDGPE